MNSSLQGCCDAFYDLIWRDFLCSQDSLVRALREQNYRLMAFLQHLLLSQHKGYSAVKMPPLASWTTKQLNWFPRETKGSCTIFTLQVSHENCIFFLSPNHLMHKCFQTSWVYQLDKMIVTLLELQDCSDLSQILFSLRESFSLLKRLEQEQLSSSLQLTQKRKYSPSQDCLNPL